MADKIKVVAVEEAERLKHLTTDAARSAAYLYPIRVRHSPEIILVCECACTES